MQGIPLQKFPNLNSKRCNILMVWSLQWKPCGKRHHLFTSHHNRERWLIRCSHSGWWIIAKHTFVPQNLLSRSASLGMRNRREPHGTWMQITDVWDLRQNPSRWGWSLCWTSKKNTAGNPRAQVLCLRNVLEPDQVLGTRSCHGLDRVANIQAAWPCCIGRPSFSASCLLRSRPGAKGSNVNNASGL